MAKANRAAETGTLEAAWRYAALGWRVFPLHPVGADGACGCPLGGECERAGKHPALLGWPTEASTDAEVIREWWSGAGVRQGIGIATGEESGLTVLDVDGELGVESLGKLAAGVGMPVTPCVQSRAGRYHYYFAYEKGVKSQANKLGEKLDTRGDGGYVVAPPSRHATGGLYTWLQAPEKVPVAPWPEFLKKGGGAAAAGKKRGRPAKETFNPANPAQVQGLVDALEHVDCDDEEKWAGVGWIMGRAWAQSDVGFALYAAWAGRSRKYDARATRKHYYEGSKAVRGSELRTVASILAWATEGGWTGAQNAEEHAERKLHVYENPYRESEMVKEMAAAAAAAPGVFSMGMRLVHIVRYGTAGVLDVMVDRDPMSYVVIDHDANTIAVELGDIAAYWALTDKGEFRRTKFNRPSVVTFMACRKFDGTKQLIAFVPHPCLRADGSLLSAVGYDAESKLYLTSEVEGLRVDAGLKRNAAKAALGRLMEPFSEYPWASPAARTVFIAALFTVGFRHLFDITPLFAFSSPKHGSGKTQLADCISRLWYGTLLSKATWTSNQEEMEKRIASFLLAGDRIVCLDNVAEGQRLEDTTLNKVLTSRRNTFRLLGKTERLELNNEATWFATGNQLQLSGDISRRALLCYIDAKVASPSARSFSISNLPAHVAEHRPALMSDALSIAASWIASGKPTPEAPPSEYGSFTEWYAFMRPLLLWMGAGDLCDAINNAQEEDSANEGEEVFAEELRRIMPPDDSGMAVMAVVKAIGTNADLRSAFNGCMGRDHDPNHINVGGLLKRLENKIYFSAELNRGFSLKKAKNMSKNVVFWRSILSDLAPMKG